MLVKIPVRLLAVDLHLNMVAKPDPKLVGQSYAHAPCAAVKVKIRSAFRGKIDLGVGIIPVHMISPVPMRRGMGRRAAARRACHYRTAGRCNIAGWEKKRAGSPEQKGEKAG